LLVEEERHGCDTACHCRGGAAQRVPIVAALRHHSSMRALRYHAFGGPDVLGVEEVPEPVPRAGEAKVRVHAAALNPLDAKIRAGHLRALPVLARPPRGLGCDFAGEIVAVGGGATERHVGERVFGSLLPFARDGAFAEYVAVPMHRLAATPDHVDDVAAAALPIAAGTALQAIVDVAHVVAGRRVLITGAAGGVGHFAVQLARYLGASVTGVCGTDNVAFVHSLGAEAVIDYTRDDFVTLPGQYDVIVDAAGASSFPRARAVLAPDGLYLSTGGDARAVVTTALGALAAWPTSRQRAIVLVLQSEGSRWRRLAALVRDGVLRPHVERVIGLDEVAAAQATMATGHSRGKVVVRLA
jgi:NADPH:quinone reductase-like Zn-dependent oxidoreductase